MELESKELDSGAFGSERSSQLLLSAEAQGELDSAWRAELAARRK